MSEVTTYIEPDGTTRTAEEVFVENVQLKADLAQMKSTLSDTQQTLRAVQEDRDEFAAKMNDAVERADQLQARCGDLEQDVARLTEEKKWHLDEICGLNGQIEAFRFVVEHWRGGGT